MGAILFTSSNVFNSQFCLRENAEGNQRISLVWHTKTRGAERQLRLKRSNEDKRIFIFRENVPAKHPEKTPLRILPRY